jgi:hypothetical protein
LAALFFFMRLVRFGSKQMQTVAQTTKRYKAPDAVIADGIKECTKCHLMLPFASFNKHSKGRLGLNSWCKECNVKRVQEYNKRLDDKKREKLAEYRAAYNRKYWQENKDQLSTVNKQWKEKNREAWIEYGKKYYEEKKEQFKLYQMEYKKNNRGKVNNWVRMRNANLKVRSFPEQKKAIEQFYQDCPRGHHVDHIVPLTHHLVCGLHVLANLQYLPAQENSRKRNKFEVV